MGRQGVRACARGGRAVIRLRRSRDEVRVEMTPLIDVVFLLLTFFVFAMVLMIRAEVLRVDLPSFSNAADASRTRSIVLVLREDGSLELDGEPIEAAALGEAVRRRRAQDPDMPLLVAADEGGERRGLIALFDLLSQEGLGEFAFIGRSSADE